MVGNAYKTKQCKTAQNGDRTPYNRDWVLETSVEMIESDQNNLGDGSKCYETGKHCSELRVFIYFFQCY